MFVRTIAVVVDVKLMRFPLVLARKTCVVLEHGLTTYGTRAVIGEGQGKLVAHAAPLSAMASRRHQLISICA